MPSHMGLNKARILIEKVCPNMLQLYMPTNTEWNKINCRLEKRYNTSIERKVGAILFDFILKSFNEDKDNKEKNYYLSFLKYFNDKCGNLRLILPEKIINSKPLKAMVMNSLQNFDNNESRCIDHLTEIIALEKLLASNYFFLNELEEEIPQGTSIDFSLVDGRGRKYLAELFTIKYHSSLLDTAENMHSFLSKRLNDKVNRKNISKEQFKEINFAFIINIHDRDDSFNIVKFEKYFDEVNTLNSWNVIFTMLKSHEIDNCKYHFDYSLVSKFIRLHKVINDDTSDNT